MPVHRLMESAGMVFEGHARRPGKEGHPLRVRLVYCAESWLFEMDTLLVQLLEFREEVVVFAMSRMGFDRVPVLLIKIVHQVHLRIRNLRSRTEVVGFCHRVPEG